MAGLYIPGQTPDFSKMQQEAGTPPPGFQPQQIPLDRIIVEISAQVSQKVYQEMQKLPIEVKAKKLSDTATLPTYGSDGAACMDLYADLKGVEAEYLRPGDTLKIGCGYAFQPPKGYVGMIFARSGLATKENLRPANCVGICDEDYLGEYIVPVYNDASNVRTVKHGDRIAQVMFIPYPKVKLKEVEELETTERGEGGFGSTGA